MAGRIPAYDRGIGGGGMPIKLENVTYSYPSCALPAVGDVTLEIADGEYVGIMGAHGSGKTTVLNLAAGLIKPDAGTVSLDGADINSRRYDRAVLRSAVGYLMDRPERQLFETTVLRDVGFALRGLGLSDEEQMSRVGATLGLVGLDRDELGAKSPLSLPRDIQRRVALAGVLVAQPKVLFFDEPFAGLDAASRRELLTLLDSLNARGTTIVIASHDADALSAHARRIAVMRFGAFIRDGRTRDIFSDYYDLVHNDVPVPAVRAAVQLLRERGVDMPVNIIDFDQLADRLKILMWRKMK